MLMKAQSDAIIRERIGRELPDFKWVARLGGYGRKRQDGSDTFGALTVDWRGVQKLDLIVMGIRFGALEALFEKIEPGYKTSVWSGMLGTPLNYLAGRDVEWVCHEPAELEAALDELIGDYMPRIREHFQRYRDPHAMLAAADSKHGMIGFLLGDRVQLARSLVALQWLCEREGFEARVERHEAAFASFEPQIKAPFERTVARLRQLP